MALGGKERLDFAQARLDYARGAAVRVFCTRPAEGFALEEAGAITSSPVTAWTQVSPSLYQTNATHISLTIPMPTGSRIYRLRP